MVDSPRTDEPSTNEIHRRLEVVRQLTDLVTERVWISGTDVFLDVTHPTSIDPLLDTVIDDPEFNLPYWAEIWPSGIALAAELLGNPQVVHDLPVLELGCGLGITAAAAMMAGADLTITDYSPHSLLLAVVTCIRAGQSIPPSRQVNWRVDYADLFQNSGEQWPVVLAADVLYEQRDIEPVLDLLHRIVTPNGIVLLAEPGRRPAQVAIDRARQRGWQIESRKHAGPWPDAKDADVVVSVHIMKR